MTEGRIAQTSCRPAARSLSFSTAQSRLTRSPRGSSSTETWCGFLTPRTPTQVRVLGSRNAYLSQATPTSHSSGAEGRRRLTLPRSLSSLISESHRATSARRFARTGHGGTTRFLGMAIGGKLAFGKEQSLALFFLRSRRKQKDLGGGDLSRGTSSAAGTAARTTTTGRSLAFGETNSFLTQMGMSLGHLRPVISVSAQGCLT